MQLQGDEDSGEPRIRVSEQGAVVQHVVWRMQGSIELERQRGRIWKSKKSEVWCLWRKRCGDRRKSRKE